MSDLLSEQQDNIFLITFNRIEKHNAFDDEFLAGLQALLNEANALKNIRVIILKANGRHFSAGADLAWMKRMLSYSEEDNTADAMQLANVMYTLYQSPKPTITMIHGCAYGGGAGLVAAADVGIAANTARFCFSEVTLGLIPAVISPYVIEAIGARSAKQLFMSGELFDAALALRLQFIQHQVPEEELSAFTMNYAYKIAKNAPEAVQQSKQLVKNLQDKRISDNVLQYTAHAIAKKRISIEGQKGLHAFLNKEKPIWD